MNINRLLREMNFQLIASLFCFQAVVTRIAASKSLYSISCNLIALAHYFLAHIHYRCLCFFFFVLCLLGIVHAGILSGCLMMLWLSLLQGIRTLVILGFSLWSLEGTGIALFLLGIINLVL